MIIRPMEEKDIPQVYEIECNTFSLPWSKDDFLNSVSDPNNIYLVVQKEDHIIGYCGLWGIAGEGQINNVAVAKSYRNKGIGGTMLTALIQKGRELGLTTFTLEVRISNKSAIQLYQNLGFQIIGIRPNFYEYPKEDALIMWL